MGLDWLLLGEKLNDKFRRNPHLFLLLPEFKQLLSMQPVGWDISIVKANETLNPGESMYPPYPSIGKQFFFFFEAIERVCAAFGF